MDGRARPGGLGQLGSSLWFGSFRTLVRQPFASLRCLKESGVSSCISSTGTYTTLLPLFNPLLGSDITLAVFVTRSTIPTDLVPPPHTTIHPDRPNLALTLASIINTTDPTSGVTVRACGPADLVAAVGNAVRGLDAGQRGGVSLEAEVYAL